MTRTRSGGSHRGAIVAAALIGVLASACAGGSSSGTSGGTDSATAFVQRVTTEFSRGQSGPLWDELYPKDQALASRSRFMQCEGNQGFHLKSFKVLETFNDSVDIEGSPNLSLKIAGGIHGDVATASIVVNSIPRVLQAAPGLHTMRDLPLPSYYPGS